MSHITSAIRLLSYMGRTKTRKNLGTSIVKVGPSASVAPKQPPSTASLIEKAQVLVTQCNYELAHKFLVRVLNQDPGHVSARELFGEVQLEMGELDAAKQVLNFREPILGQFVACLLSLFYRRLNRSFNLHLMRQRLRLPLRILILPN